jgi:predicted SAM-dependent methyltransferase
MNEIKPIPIILVTYRRVHFLERTIKSIKERTLYPHKLIVVYNKPDKPEDEDGTVEFLKHKLVTGEVDEVVWLDRNAGQSDSQNEGFALVKDEPYFVLTQDDLLPPKLSPCWLERMVHLIEKHEDFGAICMRIQRTKRVDWNESDDLIENFKSIPAVFRIHRTEDIRKLGDKPFGTRLHWESHECAERMISINKKFAMATQIYSNHLGFMSENKGYNGKFSEYYTYSKERVNQGDDKPYPDIDPDTNVPIKINHQTDRDEQRKREEWLKDAGAPWKKNCESKQGQRALLARYCVGKGIDVGANRRKVHPDAIGIDLFPWPGVDVVADGQDLWMFADGELDYVVASHNLEHYADTKKTLKEWDRVLKVGGTLAFIVPDGELRPKTIVEASHKVALTKPVIQYLLRRFLGYKIVELRNMEELEGGNAKTSILVAAIKRAPEDNSKRVSPEREAAAESIRDMQNKINNIEI